jgi:hypothetical protein
VLLLPRTLNPGLIWLLALLVGSWDPYMDQALHALRWDVVLRDVPFASFKHVFQRDDLLIVPGYIYDEVHVTQHADVLEGFEDFLLKVGEWQVDPRTAAALFAA